MSGKRYFFVFRTNGRLSPAIYEDEPPTSSMLKGHVVVYKRELEGRWLLMSLSEIMEAFRQRMAAGTLPPDNMTKPPAKKEETRVSHEIAHGSTGAYWAAFHRRAKE